RKHRLPKPFENVGNGIEAGLAGVDGGEQPVEFVGNAPLFFDGWQYKRCGGEPRFVQNSHGRRGRLCLHPRTKRPAIVVAESIINFIAELDAVDLLIGRQRDASNSDLTEIADARNKNSTLTHNPCFSCANPGEHLLGSRNRELPVQITWLHKWNIAAVITRILCWGCAPCCDSCDGAEGRLAP